MALVDRWYGSISFGTSDRKIVNVEFQVDPVDAIAYEGALTQILKDATDLGAFFLSIEALSMGTLKQKGVILKTIEDTTTYPAPSVGAYPFDRLTVSVSSGVFNYSWSIPARDPSQYTLASDGVTVITSGAGADPQVVDFISRLEAIALTKYGQLANVNRIYVKS